MSSLIFLVSLIFFLFPLLCSGQRRGTLPPVAGCPWLSCGFSSGLFLDVSGPPSLTGRLGYTPAASPALRGVGTLTARIIFPHSADGPYGCAPFTKNSTDDGTPYEGNIIVILRGGPCLLTQKQVFLVNSPNSLFLFGDNVVPATFPYGYPNQYSGDYTSAAFTIPWIVIQKDDSTRLFNAWVMDGLGNFPVITASIPRAGNLKVDQRQFITDIVTSTTLQYDSTHYPPVLSSPFMVRPDAYLNPSVDPCQMRAPGLWCENGEIVFLNWQSSGWSSTLPLSIGSMKNIIFFKIDVNNLGGAFPSTICGNWTNVRLIHLGTNKFTSFPDCFDTLNSLESFHLNDNLLTNFPSTLCSATKLLSVDLSNNLISSSACSPFQSPTLGYVNLRRNKIPGAVPKFVDNAGAGGLPASLQLNFVDLGINLFNSLPSNHFDSHPNLQSVSLLQNSLTGSLPNFASSVNLVSLDFSFNSLTGSIPDSWRSLTKVTTLILKSNRLTATKTANINSMSAVTTLDLSYNLLAVIGAPTTQNDPCYTMLALCPPSVISIDLSFNSFAGLCNFGVFTVLVNVNSVKLAGNNITSLPSDLFSSPNLKVLDFSNNQLTGSLPTATPSSNLLTADFRGNPRFSGNFPSFLAVSSSQFSFSAGSTFVCGVLTNNLNPQASFFLDNSYYNYRGCQCQSGYFNSPPQCTLIPASLKFEPTTVLSALQTGGSRLNSTISDRWYGNARQIPGMKTLWSLDASKILVVDKPGDDFCSFTYYSVGDSPSFSIPSDSTIDVARLINFLIVFDLSQFSSETDLMSFFSGLTEASSAESILTGISVADLESRQSLWPSPMNTAAFNSSYFSQWKSFTRPAAIRLRVVSNQASISFATRKISGTHFFALYCLSSLAPKGYEINLSTNQLVKSLEESHVSENLRTAIFALSGILALIIAIGFLILFSHRNSKLVRAASRPFVFLMLAFLFTLSLGSSLYAAVPSEASQICNGRLWVSCLSLMGVLSILVAKSMRVNVIFGSNILIKIRNVGDFYVLKTVIILLAIQAIMLAIFHGQEMSVARLIKLNNDKIIWGCDSQNGFDAWMGVQIAIFAFVMVIGAWVSFKTRAVPTAFNESIHILFSLQLLIVLCLILVPLDWALLKDSPDAAIVVQGGGQLLLTFFLFLFNYGPKIVYLLTGRGDDAALMKTGGTTGTAGNSSNFSKNENSSMTNGELSSNGGTELSSRS